jgi:HEPN domain-containing protein
MKPPNDPAVAPWITRRDEDLAAMEVLAERAPHLREAICFHAQQAAEKGLKALLAALGREPPHVHDLVLLLTEIGGSVPDLGIAARDCQILTPFAVLARYPRRANGGTAPLQTALAACRRITAAVDDAFRRDDLPGGPVRL